MKKIATTSPMSLEEKKAFIEWLSNDKLLKLHRDYTINKYTGACGDAEEILGLLEAEIMKRMGE